MKTRTFKGNGVTVKVRSDKHYDYYTISGEERLVNHVVSEINAIDWMQRTLPSMRKG